MLGGPGHGLLGGAVLLLAWAGPGVVAVVALLLDFLLLFNDNLTLIRRLFFMFKIKVQIFAVVSLRPKFYSL